MNLFIRSFVTIVFFVVITLGSYEIGVKTASQDRSREVNLLTEANRNLEVQLEQARKQVQILNGQLSKATVKQSTIHGQH
jgi:hypothetical protein